MPSPLLLACDFDGTLAHQGSVDDATYEAIATWKAAGHRFAIITGRVVDDLLGHFVHGELLDLLAAEDGCVLADPSNGEIVDLGGSPQEELLAALRDRHVPLGAGRVAIYSRREYEPYIREAIEEAGGRYHIIFNFDAAMILPNGLHKGAGLAAAARRLNVKISDTIAAGDAENDQPLLSAAGFPVAVANAIPSLKKIARLVTRGEKGAGVVELIERLLTDGALRRTA